MKHIPSILRALKIFDPDNSLSLTSIAMFVIIVKLALAPALDWAIITAFFITLLNYNTKKWFAKSKATKEVADKDRLSQLEDVVKSVKTALALKK